MAESYHTNLPNVAAAYIKQLRIPVTATSLKQQLNENPYFPSLYSISNVFERLHIEHKTFKIDKENFEQLTPPFIAYVLFYFFFFPELILLQKLKKVINF